MTFSLARAGRRAAAAALWPVLLLMLGACDRQAPPAPVTGDAAPAAGSASSPLEGVKPHTESVTGPTKAGPADASTAIGGVVGNQESGGATKGSPAPTGGDGASAPAASTPAAK